MKMNETILETVKTFGLLFYIGSPNETSFEKFEEVPSYVEKAAHPFYFLIILEWVILYLKGETTKFRINDGITSISGGLLQEIVRMLCKGVEYTAYIYIYENFCLYNLPWNSPVTWIIAALATDLGYYWVHRACHETNLMWAAHQMHHSSEYYNLTTALRQSMFHDLLAWPFYLPMALFIPPSMFLVHTQINLIYQFWIHTSAVGKLPAPIEFIFNTPSHHKIHHGCNRYCIDKNYAGWLIIWDRMFGTFEPEGEEIAYGLTHAVNSFNPLWLQVQHFVYMIGAFKNAEGFGNKLKTIFYGPGWGPGKPRTGLLEDLPDHKPPMPIYNPESPAWHSLYLLSHFIVVSYVFFEVAALSDPFFVQALCLMGFMIVSLSCLGSVADRTSWSTPAEALRCFVCFLALRFLHTHHCLQAIFFSSCVLWSYMLVVPQLSSKKKGD